MGKNILFFGHAYINLSIEHVVLIATDCLKIRNIDIVYKNVKTQLRTLFPTRFPHRPT